MRHPIKKTPTATLRESPPAPQWPNYTGTSQFVGVSPSGRATVYVDPTLGQPALQNAQDLVEDADRVVAANDAIFGTTGGPVSVILFALGGATDGTGGADHYGCNYEYQIPGGGRRLRCVSRSATPPACRRCSRPS
jgi:hypothetical protein